jgi:hypothetical protein
VAVALGSLTGLAWWLVSVGLRLTAIVVLIFYVARFFRTHGWRGPRLQ